MCLCCLHFLIDFSLDVKFWVYKVCKTVVSTLKMLIHFSGLYCLWWDFIHHMYQCFPKWKFSFLWIHSIFSMFLCLLPIWLWFPLVFFVSSMLFWVCWDSSFYVFLYLIIFSNWGDYFYKAVFNLLVFLFRIVPHWCSVPFL